MRELTFFEREKRQKTLLFVFFFVVFVTFLILWFGYFKKGPQISIEISFPEIIREKIEIDFSVFESPMLKEMESFPKIEEASKEEIGKENPFSP